MTDLFTPYTIINRMVSWGVQLQGFKKDLSVPETMDTQFGKD
jgi:hypothetical protein